MNEHRIRGYLDKWAQIEYGRTFREVIRYGSKQAYREFVNLEEILREYEGRLTDKENNIKELEKVASEWMSQYQKLKDKYEPEELLID